MSLSHSRNCGRVNFSLRSAALSTIPPTVFIPPLLLLSSSCLLIVVTATDQERRIHSFYLTCLSLTKPVPPPSHLPFLLSTWSLVIKYQGGYVITYCLRCDVLTAVIVNGLLRPLKVFLHFRGACCLRRQGRRKTKQETSVKRVSHLSWLSAEYAALYAELEIRDTYYWLP
jgi:hypothetical protein